MVPDLAGAVPGNAGISSSSHSLYYVVGMDTLCRVCSTSFIWSIKNCVSQTKYIMCIEFLVEDNRCTGGTFIGTQWRSCGKVQEKGGPLAINSKN